MPEPATRRSMQHAGASGAEVLLGVDTEGAGSGSMSTPLNRRPGEDVIMAAHRLLEEDLLIIQREQRRVQRLQLWRVRRAQRPAADATLTFSSAGVSMHCSETRPGSGSIAWMRSQAIREHALCAIQSCWFWSHLYVTEGLLLLASAGQSYALCHIAG